MSVTKRAKRLGGAGDFFETPGWATRAVLPLVLDGLPADGAILEPAAGVGAILRELIGAGIPRSRLAAFELREDCEGTLTELAGLVRCPRDTLEWLKDCPWPRRLPPAIKLVITNPPFALPEESDGLAAFARALLSSIGEGGRVVLLGRLTWAAPSRGRSEWVRANMPDIHVLDRRPAFIRVPKCLAKGCRWRAPAQALSNDAPALHTHERFDGERSDLDCPRIGTMITASSQADADEYAWYVWEKGRTRAPTWSILRCESAAETRAREGTTKRRRQATTVGATVPQAVS